MTEAFDILYQSVFIEEDHLRTATLLPPQETLECEGDHPGIIIQSEGWAGVI